MLMVVTTTVSFYIITAYTPTFGKGLKLSEADNFRVICCVGLSNFFWLPIMGALSDRVGRKPLLQVSAVLLALSAYPLIYWLVQEPSLRRLLLVELWLSFLYATYNGAMVVTLTEIMPREVRTAGFSLAYSLATAIFGGFTPALCTFLIEKTGNQAAPGWWMTVAALCGWVAAQFGIPRAKAEDP
jgi:MFS family permease